jgi:hypothetical protein
MTKVSLCVAAVGLTLASAACTSEGNSSDSAANPSPYYTAMPKTPPVSQQQAQHPISEPYTGINDPERPIVEP